VTDSQQVAVALAPISLTAHQCQLPRHPYRTAEKRETQRNSTETAAADYDATAAGVND